MKNKIVLILSLAFVLFLNTAKAQTEIQPLFGIGHHNNENFDFKRYGVAFNNVIKANGNHFLESLGVYYILENAKNVNFTEDKSTTYTRDIVGIRYKLNPKFTLFTGVGLFQKGIFSSGSRLRKEFGIAYTQSHFSLELGMSGWVGPTANIGYVIPFKK